MEFVMLCGLPASGKSTYADKMKSRGYIVHSSDSIREEIFGNEATQGDNRIIFAELHKRIKDSLNNGYNTIYDATNINSKRRRLFLEEIRNIDCIKNIVVFATDYEKCLKNNSNRERKVPNDVIRRMYENFNVPCYFEGWNNIHLIWDFSVNDYNLFKKISELNLFHQENSYHSLSLGEHLSKCAEYLSNKYSLDTALKFAGIMHDIGKPFVKSFTNSKGELTNEAHYYNHNNVSSYDSLFYIKAENFEHSDKFIIDISGLICWHMQPYFMEKDKTIEKYKRIFGEDFFNRIMRLHEADIYAH